MTTFLIERNIPGASDLTAAARGNFPADVVVEVAAVIGPKTADA